MLLSAPFTEVVSPGSNPEVPHLHRPEVKMSKGHQDTRPLPKLEIFAKYKQGQSTHDHGHPLVQRAHFTDKQTEAKQLSVEFHVPNLGPFLLSCHLKLRSSTSCWFFSPFLRRAHDWVFLPQDKHGKGASDGGSGERGCGRVPSRPSAQLR